MTSQASARVSRIREAVHEARGMMTELLVSAVQCPSVTGNELAVAELFGEWMTGLGWAPKLVSVEEPSSGRGNRLNVILRCGSSDGPLVVLNGHLDVVPPGADSAWARAPFSGDVVDGSVHGRGTVDMKGGIIAGIWALHALDAAGIELGCQVELQLVVGEETTGVGTRAAVRDLDLATVSAAVVLEPTRGRIVTVNTGLQFFEVHVDGRTAHSSAPWEGVDAFDKLLIVRNAMKAEAERRAAQYSHPLLSDVPSPMPFAVGIVRAGTYRASVPGTARMGGRFGLRPRESVQEARQCFRRAVDEAANRDPWLRLNRPEFKWDHQGLPGWETSPDASIVQELLAARTVVAGVAEMDGFTAGSDAAVYGAALVPTVVFGPGDVALAHAPNEAVALSDVMECAETLALALAGLS